MSNERGISQSNQTTKPKQQQHEQSGPNDATGPKRRTAGTGQASPATPPAAAAPEAPSAQHHSAAQGWWWGVWSAPPSPSSWGGEPWRGQLVSLATPPPLRTSSRTPSKASKSMASQTWVRLGRRAPRTPSGSSTPRA